MKNHIKRHRLIALSLVLLVTLAGAAWGQQSAGTPAAKAEFEQGEAAFKKQDYATAAASYRKAIELDPDFIAAHEKFIAASAAAARAKSAAAGEQGGSTDTEVSQSGAIAVYEEWARKYPNKPAIQWALGDLYMYKDYDKVEQYSRKAVELDPKFARAWQSLALIEEVRGNNAGQVAYLKKAAEAVPDDPAPLFYYANSLKRTNRSEYEKASLQVAERFPQHERGAQALYWLSFEETNPARKVELLERLKTQYPVDKFNWSASGMSMLFDAYRKSAPSKAAALAEEMVKANPTGSQNKTWQTLLDYQKNIIQARALMAEKKFAEAVTLLGATQLPRYIDTDDLFLLKAAAIEGAGQTQQAYDELLKQVAKEPAAALRTELNKLGSKLSKAPAQVEADIWGLWDAQAKPAKDFTLKHYGDEKDVSLADYRGKVVLLNFWYPFCGPCRGENPSLQKVLEQIGREKFAILAVNIYPKEDQFVLPYFKGNRFDFVPLRGNTEFAEKEWSARGFPTNYLIDPEGRVVFKLGPMRGDAEEQKLELRIRMLLARQAKGQKGPGSAR